MTTTETHCTDCDDFHPAYAPELAPSNLDPAELANRLRDAADLFEPTVAPDDEPGPDAAGESYVWPGVEIIHQYTREDAIRDGELVDVTAVAREAGITLPVAMTRAVYEDCVAWSDEDNRRKGTVQDEAGRLWDVVYMTRAAIRRTRPGADRVTVRLVRTPRPGRARAARSVELVAVCGPGDRGEPVITLMCIGED